MKKYLHWNIFILILALVASSCNAPATPIPTDTATPTSSTANLQVAYIKDRNVWIWSESGGRRALTDSGDVLDVTISDDGKIIAYVREAVPLEQEQIWVIGVDGSDPRLLVSEEDLRAANPEAISDVIRGLGPYELDWLPGTHILYYNTRALMEYGIWLYDDLYTVNADTLEKTTILSSGNGGMFYLSPDGSQVALVTPTTISLANIDGSNLRSGLVTFPEVGTYSEYRYYPRPIWAADSSAIRVAIPPEDTLQEPIGPTNLWHIPADGSPAILIGSIDAIPFAWPDNAISPDLEHIAYVKSVGGSADNITELHLSNPENTSDTNYRTGENIRFVSWLPDSSRFLFVSRDKDAVSGLYLGTVDGTPSLLSAGEVIIHQIVWLNQTHYLYTVQGQGMFELRYGTVESQITLLLDYCDIAKEFDYSK